MRVKAERDYYAILGVDETASEEEIKRAYRRLALQHHPDRNPGDRRAEERFKQVSEAYAVLMDPGRRRDYDALRRSRQEGSRSGQAAPPEEPRWREEEVFRDLFSDPRAAAVFDELRQEWARMGLRFNEAFLRDVFFRGRGVVVVTPFGVRWVGSFGPRASAERVAEDARAAGSDFALSRPGLAGWLWGRLKETAPVRFLRETLALPHATRRGDLQYEIALSTDALRDGGRYRLTIERGGRREEVLVRVPAGLRAGTRLRLRGKGEPGLAGSPGDLYLHVRLKA
jgi:curved DNA-binding protein CbpA